MTSVSVIPEAGGFPPPRAVDFDGPRGGLIVLLLKNFFLNLITLGIYRFWARTHLRGYFWRNVSVAGEPLEYVGRGLELFIGFLIVMGILMSIGIPVMILQLLFASYGPIAEQILQAIQTFILFVLLQIAIFRSRRYRLTRTVWRGIRCGLDGESGRFALMSTLWGLVVLVTLGFASPWRRVAINEYLMNNTRFGRQHFTFDGSGKDLFPAWSIVNILWLAMLALLVGLNFEFISAYFDFIKLLQNDGDVAGFAWPKIAPALWPLALIPLAILAQLWYSVLQFKYFTDRTQFGGVTFQSSLRTRQVLWYLVVYVLLVLVSIGVTIGVFVAVIGISVFGGAEQVPNEFAPLLMIPLMFAAFALLAVVKVGWLYYQILRAACRTLAVENLQFVDRVVQEADDGVRFGEGLADVLDYGDI